MQPHKLTLLLVFHALPFQSVATFITPFYSTDQAVYLALIKDH